MATDLTVFLQDRPGTLAELGEALGRAGVNIEGGCGFPCEGEGEFHLLVQDAVAAKRVLHDAGIEVHAEREVLEVKVEGRPGEFGEIARRLADAQVNIDLLYLNVKGQMVMGVDDRDKARQVL
jgi:hypothetical protein